MSITDVLGDVSAAETTILGVLIVTVSLVIRALIRGDLVPRSTVEREMAEKDDRLSEQSEVIKVTVPLLREQQDTISDLTDGVANLGEAAKLNVKVAEVLRSIRDPSGDDAQ